MDDVFARILWFGILASASAYITYLTFSGIFKVEEKQLIKIRDDIQVGQHHLSGIVMVPTPCDQLTAKAIALSPSVYAINLHTWYDPAVRCEKKLTPRSFSSIVFAPSFGIQFVVFLNGEVLPFEITTVMPNR